MQSQMNNNNTNTGLKKIRLDAYKQDLIQLTK